MPRSQKSYRSAIVWGGLALVAAIFVLLYTRSPSHEAVQIRVAAASRQDLLRTVSTNGKVEPVAQFQAHAPFAGVVQKILVDVGAKVRSGQPLVQMSDVDARSRIATANATLRSAEATNADLAKGGTQEERNAVAADLQRYQIQVQQADKDLAALQALQQKGAVSASEVEAARQRLSTTQAALQQTQQRSSGRYSSTDRTRAAAQLADARASFAAANDNLKTIHIRAPFAGSVYSVPVAQFDFVPAGEDLMDVADLNHLQIRAYFDEPEIGQLASGQPVKIIWDAKPNQTWHGHIYRAPTTIITYNTRNVGECLITVDDAKGDLLPNTNVTVTVTTSQRNHVLSVPREALHTEGLNTFVYRVVNRKLVRTPVQIGVVNLNRVEIAGGLGENDIVALGATSNRDLADGLEVRPVQ